MSENPQAYIANSKIYSFTVMTGICFIIGLFTVLNQQYQIPLQAAILPHHGNTVNSLITMLNFSWFLAYPLSEGAASLWLEKYGYKRTFVYAMLILIVGLTVYEFAMLLSIYTPYHIRFFNDPVPIGFFVFLFGSYLIGSAIAILQTGLMLFQSYPETKLIHCKQRHIIGNTSNALGMAVAPLVVSFILFRGISPENIESKDFIMPFAGIIGFMIIILLTTGFIKLPSIISIPDFSVQLPKNTVISRQMGLGIWAIFFCVGAEVAVGANINLYATNLGGNFALNATYMAALYWTFFLAGRLVNLFIKSIPYRIRLRTASTSAAILLILSMAFSNPWILCGVGFFHSFMWPAIFSLAIKPLGIYNARGSEMLMIGITGGGIIPVVQGITADLFHGNWQWTWIIVILCEAYLFFYGTKRHCSQLQKQVSGKPDIKK